MKRTPLYEQGSEPNKVRCRICGKEMWDVGYGSMGVVSHARKHVRQGEAIEVRKPSPRCYAGYDVFFYVKEADEHDRSG